VSVADLPAASRGVTLPTHAFFVALALAVVQSLKSCDTAPLLVTLKVIVPIGRFENFESLKFSSVGLPAVTVITVTFGAELFPALPAAEPAVTTTQTATPRKVTADGVR